MTATISSHQQAAFTTPVNTPGVGDALDANIVRGNDNSLRTTYNAHDADASIHFISGPTASRPSAGVPDRKYLDTTTGRLYYDNGSIWSEVGYALGVVPTDQYFYLFDTRI
jgi:hypothetical protein